MRPDTTFEAWLTYKNHSFSASHLQLTRDNVLDTAKAKAAAYAGDMAIPVESNTRAPYH